MLCLCCTFPVNVLLKYIGNRNKYFLNQRYLFYPVKPQIIAFRSTDVNILFSDIRHENRQTFIGEEIMSIKPT